MAASLVSPPNFDMNGTGAFRTPSPPQLRQMPRSKEDLEGDIKLMINRGVSGVLRRWRALSRPLAGSKYS